MTQLIVILGKTTPFDTALSLFLSCMLVTWAVGFVPTLMYLWFFPGRFPRTMAVSLAVLWPLLVAAAILKKIGGD